MSTFIPFPDKMYALWSTTTSTLLMEETSTLSPYSLAVIAVVVYLVTRWVIQNSASVMDRICNRTYIYNCCWEDPAVDHEILNIQPNDVIFRICSAGDIVLDYAIEGPSKIVVCDMNQHQ